jgi:hypothetical protein
MLCVNGEARPSVVISVGRYLTIAELPSWAASIVTVNFTGGNSIVALANHLVIADDNSADLTSATG